MTAASLGRRTGVAVSHLVVLGLLALVVAAGFLVSSRFGTTRNLANILEQAATLGLVSIGQTLVVLTGGIDLSIGAVVSAATVLLASVAGAQPWLLWPAVLLTLAAGATVGALNGYLVDRLGVHPLIVTLGTASALNGAVLLYTLQPTGSVPPDFEVLAYGRIFGLPVGGAIMLAAFLLTALFLGRTPLGRQIYAVGGSAEAARLTGISVRRVILVAYALAGMFAALAAVLLVSRTGVGDPRIGDQLTLASITPVIVGGTILAGGKGGVGGTLLGVFLVAALANVLNYLNVSTFWQWVVQGLIIIVAVSVYVERRSR